MKRRLNILIAYFFWITWTGKTKTYGEKSPWNEVVRRCLHKECTFTGEIEKISHLEFRKCIHWGCNMMDPL